MGNRAVIQIGNNADATGIYLHWNGGRESVEAFLRVARELGVRCGDEDYCAARLAQIIGNFFGGTASIGVGRASSLDRDNGDNGTFIIDDKMEIVGRLHARDDDYMNTKEGAAHSDSVYKITLAINKPIFDRSYQKKIAEEIGA